ncbi:MAG: hypothetical protein WAO71_03490 [Gallionella sp.]
MNDVMIMEMNEPVSAVNLNQLLTRRLLAMANQYKDEGDLRQATEIYWTLVEGKTPSLQADEAKAALLELAEEYERNDGRHMARGIYERMMRLEC